MDYLPEWKIYLWKKLLLNKEKFDQSTVAVNNFIFFSDAEQRTLMMNKSQRAIDSIKHAYDAAVARQEAMNIDMSEDQSIDDDYYSFHPIKIMSALIELMDSKPPVLSIKARLDKRYVVWYRQTKKSYEASQYKKHLASLGGRGSTPYKPDPKYMNDPHCGLSGGIYEKTEAGQILTPDEFRELAGFASHSTYDYLVLELKIDQSELQKRLAAYLDSFIEGNLVPPRSVQYFDPNLQKKNVHSSIHAMTAKFGRKNLPITPERIAQYGGWPIGEEKHYRIFETLFSLEKSGVIKIEDLREGEIIVSLLTTYEQADTATKKTVKKAFDLEKEKEKIVAIKFAADFKVTKEKWFNMKGIIDTICEKLPPVEDADGIIIQPITLDRSTFSAERLEILPAVLKHAYDNGVATYPVSKSRVVISSEPVRRFLDGENILIKNLDKFDDYRAQINDLCNFIEREGESRFSPASEASSSRSQSSTDQQQIPAGYHGNHLVCHSTTFC